MVRINKVYTKTGDQGMTRLIGGAKVSKSSARIDCYGTIDELNATIGMTISALQGTAGEELLVGKLLRIQNELFNVGTQLAAPEKEGSGMPDISSSHVEALELEIDACNESLPDLKSFVLPGGSSASACFHLARTVCRRAERAVVALADNDHVENRHIMYLNRLSDALFVFGRYSLVADKLPEQLWQPESV